ncbi:hypothetical protein DIR46_16580 [Massilia oculi]|uniref:Uncharacterized protein n=1 Tax=Massilia oculi TaxID=945844 RepID=A0A2S2DKI0_9BURK|nr:hypothetical protein DIR46_16580 [Massilia oculi]
MSLVLGQVLDDEGIDGFMYVCGHKYSESGAVSSHAWLQNGDWVVDITADQFEDVDDAVIVSNCSTWHDEWKRDHPTAGTLRQYGCQVPQLWRVLSKLELEFDSSRNP